ncbi:NUDIX domain-containing protein [Vitreimonas flagellata]|uniref:NUDIX domain-containing protein n=1 Tax=Vitreimonas flagellata TaxID=2560861 RepID=UPI001431DEDF|nr:NUDIX hydrolase [Vitreimonas flagellata]
MAQDRDQKSELVPVVRSITRKLEGFLNVDEAVVTYPDFEGSLRTITRMSLERGDSVAVLAVDPTRKIVWLVEQFRYPTLAGGSGVMTELPAGVIDALETPQDAARRETEEEIGARPDALEHIATFYVSPGASSERIYLYYAALVGVSPDEAVSKRLRDAEEDIRLVERSVEDFIADAQGGRLADAKTLIGALWLDKHRVRLQL